MFKPHKEIKYRQTEYNKFACTYFTIANIFDKNIHPMTSCPAPLSLFNEQDVLATLVHRDLVFDTKGINLDGKPLDAVYLKEIFNDEPDTKEEAYVYFIRRLSYSDGNNLIAHRCAIVRTQTELLLVDPALSHSFDLLDTPLSNLNIVALDIIYSYKTKQPITYKTSELRHIL